jgi:hypothetical protein
MRNNAFWLAHLLVKAAELLIFVWYGHAREVLSVSNRLEVTANEKKVHLVRVLALKLANTRIYGVQFAMTASLNCNLILRPTSKSKL